MARRYGCLYRTDMDLRTRWDNAESIAEAEAFDPGAFLDHDFGAALEEASALLHAASRLRLRTLVINLDDSEFDRRTWTASRDSSDRFEVRSGHDDRGDRVVEVNLTAQQLNDLVHDQLTPIGMFTAGTLDLVQGRIGHLLDWWLVLRSALDHREVYVPGSIDLPDDLTRSFTLDDDRSDMLEFLRRAGYLHLRGVFDQGEMDQVSAEMDAAAPSYHPDDANSWWATLADGTRQVVRMQRFHERSEAAAAILVDDRFLGLGTLPACGHGVEWADGNQLEALFKPIGVTEGISDVPWHKDCSLGRHSFECCRLTVGISVSGGGPTSGQLRVIAGSHRALIWPSLLDTSALDLPDVALATETGDVTVHLSCTLHMAQPPTERERRVMYTGFTLPPLDRAASAAAKHRLLSVARERAPLTTSQQST